MRVQILDEAEVENKVVRVRAALDCRRDPEILDKRLS